MQFKANVKDLVAALDAVSLVKPTLPKGRTAYLFRVEEDGICRIYSREDSHVARASFPITHLDRVGSFLLPAQNIAGFKNLKSLGTTVSFESSVVDNVFEVRWSTPEGFSTECRTDNPNFLAPCEADMKDSVSSNVFCASLLKLGLDTVKGYAAGKKNWDADPQFRTVQIFDKSMPEWEKGDGVMYAADGCRAIYFECDAFKGKPLSVAIQSVPLLVRFLGKFAAQDVTIHDGPCMAFVEGGLNLLGYQNRVTLHVKYAYYPFEKDTYVFKTDKAMMLMALQIARVELDKDRDKVRLHYSASKGELTITTQATSAKSTSMPVKIRETVLSGDADLGVNVNVDHMIDLFVGAKCNEVELRICKLKGTSALFRTVETFWVDRLGKPTTENAANAKKCRVTRFMPSKD